MVKPVNVCVPVLRRYDLLRRLLISLHESTVQPVHIFIIDNGRDGRRLEIAMNVSRWPSTTFMPDEPMGVAESWNWFITNVPEERIISNDDIVFSKTSLERMVGTAGDLVFGLGFSCFLIRSGCVQRVGLFDEEISPGYAYWEDLDYQERLKQHPEVAVVNAALDMELVHGDGKDGSQTWRAGSEAEIRDHWRRYDIAKANFIKKWGQLPEGCT
jgi:hypothetical protein